jgi:hypothetical protein
VGGGHHEAVERFRILKRRTSAARTASAGSIGSNASLANVYSSRSSTLCSSIMATVEDASVLRAGRSRVTFWRRE